MRNIREQRFTKADTLTIIPTLKPKNFMNWSEAGLIEMRIEGKRRFLSALSVIKLATIHEAVEFGFRLPAAVEVAKQIEPRVLELWAALPQFLPEGSQRKTMMFPPLGEGPAPIFYAMFEVDLHLGIIFSRILQHVAAQKRAAPPVRRRKAAKKGSRK